MNTLLLLAGAYLVLQPKPASTGSSSGSSTSAPAPVTRPQGTDLAAAFGAFVGSLISEATKDN